MRTNLIERRKLRVTANDNLLRAAEQCWRTYFHLTDDQIAWARIYFEHGASLAGAARQAQAKTETLPC